MQTTHTGEKPYRQHIQERSLRYNTDNFPDNKYKTEALYTYSTVTTHRREAILTSHTGDALQATHTLI